MSPYNISLPSLFQTFSFHEIPGDIDTRDDAPDRIGQHERDSIQMVRIGEEADRGDEVHGIVKNALRAQCSPLVRDERGERHER